MKRKIYIDDPVKRHTGKEETELPFSTAIRFEVGNSKLTVKFCTTSGSIEIRQSGNESQMWVIPQASNKIIIT